MLPPVAVCRQARKSRDPRFDGRFFIGVLSTGIYCRTICPARMPAEDNVTYLASAAAATDAGFRPCKRCRPEAALSLPEWTLGSDTVLRALRLIEAGFLNQHTTAELAGKLNIGERQLHRLFVAELGTSASSVARLYRASLAVKLLRTTTFAFTQVAFQAGYGSTSRFNHDIKAIFHATPSELRASQAHRQCTMRFLLPLRGPYASDWVFEYLQHRALTGLELVEGGPGDWRYLRRVDREPGGQAEAKWLSVEQADAHHLAVTVPEGCDESLHSLLGRVKRVFDLNADGDAIHDYLMGDAHLKPLAKRAPGLRVPGAWDGFETCVRAILGQQVSVARGTELANTMIERYGGGFFPTPEELIDREVAELGMPGRRGRAVSRLAELLIDGAIVVDDAQDPEAFYRQLTEIDGIGPWTANYIRMRVCKDPDAFPDNDWVVLKELECRASQARKRAEAWRPWRAYALMYLWYSASLKRQASGARARQSTTHRRSA